ncbi:MAG: protein-methionine-sulfoxide reductase catalytic subunit MsrP [Candidatus Binatia bacterium]
MLVKTPPPSQPKSSEITERAIGLSRRQFLGRGSGLVASGSTLGLTLRGVREAFAAGSPRDPSRRLSGLTVNHRYTVPGPATSYEAATSYNNFYELGTEKTDPARNADKLRTKPWTLRISGQVEKAGDYHLEDFIAPYKLEERVYRLRCVEAWSMVIPWVGFPLADVIARARPTSKAKFVKFTTLYDPDNLPGQRRPVLDWPYVEGLRLDEALHPLTILAVGMYGEILPNQNGAPLRLVVPWKYGYKSIKSVVKMDFLDYQPISSWTRASPREYPFYSNVNPNVPHPRWSQKEERRITKVESGLSVLGSLLEPKVPTQMLNGYTEVASLYSAQDLGKSF